MGFTYLDADHPLTVGNFFRHWLGRLKSVPLIWHDVIQ